MHMKPIKKGETSPHHTKTNRQNQKKLGHANDTKHSIAGLPDMFDRLLQENGGDALQAVRVLVSLIVGEKG